MFEQSLRWVCGSGRLRPCPKPVTQTSSRAAIFFFGPCSSSGVYLASAPMHPHPQSPRHPGSRQLAPKTLARYSALLLVLVCLGVTAARASGSSVPVQDALRVRVVVGGLGDLLLPARPDQPLGDLTAEIERWVPSRIVNQ